MFLFEASSMARLSSPSPEKSRAPRGSSAYELALNYRGVVASYASPNFGYIIRRASDGQYHFVRFEKNRYDLVSPGHSSRREAARAAYLNATEGSGPHRNASWLQLLKADGGFASKLHLCDIPGSTFLKGKQLFGGR